MNKFQIIYADPPWAYKNKRTGGSMKSGAEEKYNTLTIEEICSLSPYIKDISDKNSCLFLWSTVPFLQEAFKVMESWGFKYKTMITWRKIMSLGMGYWYRGQTEHLLFGIKGKVPAFRYQKANFYESKSEKHSKKPDYFRELIELSSNKFGNNRIELFARQQNTGWTCLGNEIDGKDINVALKELIGENND